MAKGGAFNVSKLIEQLGLQTVSGDTMRVLETIQPTMAVGDLKDVTPPHVAATEMFNANPTGAAGEVGIVELQCLAPGGGFIEWVFVSTVFSNARMRVVTVGAAIATVVPSVGQLSREPIVSIVREGSIPPSGLPGVLIIPNNAELIWGNRQMFIPRGSFFQIEHNTLATQASTSFSFREVPASEHVPA